jgi:hypothetical protein
MTMSPFDRRLDDDEPANAGAPITNKPDQGPAWYRRVVSTVPTLVALALVIYLAYSVRMLPDKYAQGGIWALLFGIGALIVCLTDSAHRICDGVGAFMTGAGHALVVAGIKLHRAGKKVREKGRELRKQVARILGEKE